MHPSNRRRNMIRTLNTELSRMDLGGAEFFPDGDERTPPMDCPAWIRATIQDSANSYAGRVGGAARATRHDMQMLVECWVLGSSASQIAAVDRVEELAELVAARFRYSSIQMLDYVASPEAPAPLQNTYLRFLQPPTVQRPDPTEGFQRRLVVCPFTYFSQEE